MTNRDPYNRRYPRLPGAPTPDPRWDDDDVDAMIFLAIFLAVATIAAVVLVLGPTAGWACAAAWTLMSLIRGLAAIGRVWRRTA